MNQAYGNTRLARVLVWFAAFVNVALLFMLCSLASMGAAWLLALLLMILVDGPVAFYAYNQGLFFEWRVKRTFQHVCAGLGGNFVGEKNDYLASARAGMQSRGQYYVATQKKVAYPELKNIRGNGEAWTAEVRFFDGQTIDDYNKHADAFALAFSVPFVTFDLAENGLISVRAGKVPVPDAYSHPRQLQTPLAANNARAVPQVAPVVPNVYAYARVVPDLTYELELLKGVPVARDLNGHVCRIPIESNHWFDAARTGGGKSSWIWSLVLGLEPAWRAGLVKFWGIDPKMIELAIGRDWWEHYADDDESSVNLLEQCVKDMHERARKMQGISRKFTPSVETPLNIVIVDEMGYLSALQPDRKLRERAERAIASILAKGRAPGFALVGAVQDPRKETCNFRDLFSIRIAGGLPAPMVDLVLGEGMHAAGAACEQIPLGNAGAGVAYVISETTLKPVCVRAAWCSDDDIRGMMAGLSPIPAPNAGGAALVKDEPPFVQGYERGYVPQLDFDSKPLGQFRFRVE